MAAALASDAPRWASGGPKARAMTQPRPALALVAPYQATMSRAETAIGVKGGRLATSLKAES
jgi:hypothetical protein